MSFLTNKKQFEEENILIDQLNQIEELKKAGLLRIKISKKP
jgi:hypothetical protein